MKKLLLVMLTAVVFACGETSSNRSDNEGNTSSEQTENENPDGSGLETGNEMMNSSDTTNVQMETDTTSFD